jgi:hypothetical protein
MFFYHKTLLGDQTTTGKLILKKKIIVLGLDQNVLYQMSFKLSKEI